MEKLAEKTFVIRYWSDCGEEMRIKVKAIDAKTAKRIAKQKTGCLIKNMAIAYTEGWN